MRTGKRPPPQHLDADALAIFERLAATAWKGAVQRENDRTEEDTCTGKEKRGDKVINRE